MSNMTSPVSVTGSKAFALKLAICFAISVTTVAAEAQNVQLYYSGNNTKLIAAVAQANRILNDPAFYQRVSMERTFDNSSFDGTQVAQEMQNLHKVIEVTTYWNPLSKANAGTVEEIKMNSAKLKRATSSIVNTLVHEAVHGVDYLTDKKYDYTHNGNRRSGQDRTAPWVIGGIAENMASAPVAPTLVDRTGKLN